MCRLHAEDAKTVEPVTAWAAWEPVIFPMDALVELHGMKEKNLDGELAVVEDRKVLETCPHGTVHAYTLKLVGERFERCDKEGAHRLMMRTVRVSNLKKPDPKKEQQYLIWDHLQKALRSIKEEDRARANRRKDEMD